jgi:hypothetical protein
MFSWYPLASSACRFQVTFAVFHCQVVLWRCDVISRFSLVTRKLRELKGLRLRAWTTELWICECLKFTALCTRFIMFIYCLHEVANLHFNRWFISRHFTFQSVSHLLTPQSRWGSQRGFSKKRIWDLEKQRFGWFGDPSLAVFSQFAVLLFAWHFLKPENFWRLDIAPQNRTTTYCDQHTIPG